MSFLAAALHVACIFGGGDWYRFFGAGEQLARMDEQGSWTPAMLTAGIAAILFVWGLYALSAAGQVRPLPLRRTALIAISLVLLLRAVQVFFPATWGPDLSLAFMVVTSAIVGVFALLFAIGTWRAWPVLKVIR